MLGRFSLPLYNLSIQISMLSSRGIFVNKESTYYGKSHFKVKMCERLGILVLTGNRVKGDDDSAIKEHLLFSNNAPDFEDFSILTTNNNDFKVTFIESLLINRDRSLLNRNKKYLLLELFDS